MQYPFYINETDDEKYTTPHLHPHLPILFLGTTKGCIEMWDINTGEKLAELRYLVVNDYGDYITVDDPVEGIASNQDCTLIYGFMGNAAYCIDVDLKLIIQQIPITEQVINGCVSENNGKIAVITKVGYLSEWSPKFYERVYNYELLSSIDNSYVVYGMNGTLIMLLQDRVIIFGEENGHKNMAELDTDSLPIVAERYLRSVRNDANNHFFVELKDGSVMVSDNVDHYGIDINDPFYHGKYKADLLLSKTIDNMNLEFKFIKDYRLQRRGRDRYDAEVENLTDDNPIELFHDISVILDDDQKTLIFAFEEYKTDDLHKKTQAKDVIYNICRRHSISPKYLNHVYNTFGPDNNQINLIDYARLYEFNGVKKKDQIKKSIIVSTIFSILLILLNTFLISLFSLISQLLFLISQIILLFRWSKINTRPYIPWIEEYRLFRLINWFLLPFLIYRLFTIYVVWGFCC